ncbi:hypothetical protein SAMN02983003_1208 [Devosia enhydra]|uniref:Peptidase propeptide and YPEB domain-containing protein n=1 Tax=Devosia enhydra TaxID=665118 RepID=A0A1K2HVF5_9HYPH|nr:hypothetical protein [Devosia enhydra]SFZ82666.1 hypothetical protein SAMN02983003_1208 [Devosia enhydra]
MSRINRTVSFKSPARRRIAALALAGVVALGAALPAQAQGFSFGFGWDRDDGRIRVPQLCLLTDASVRQAIRDQGYANVTMAPNNRGLIEARGTRGGWVYLLTVRACTGDILEVRRLRPA